MNDNCLEPLGVILDDVGYIDDFAANIEHFTDDRVSRANSIGLYRHNRSRITLKCLLTDITDA